MSVKVKICGVTNIEDAHAALAFGADAIGLNFCPQSPRAVTMERACEISRGLARPVCLVGVFANASRHCVCEVAAAVELSALQFHGDELPEDCLGWGDLTVIKALHAMEQTTLATQAVRYATRYILVDTPSTTLGGSGRTFDWGSAAGVPRRRLLVAGGLTPANVSEAVRCLRPAGVDVASGVELGPGRKDHAKLKAFIDAAKAT